jgi:ATP-dependent DNA helicase RecG
MDTALDSLIAEPEGERLEFKEAKKDFDFGRLAKYCSAIANEGGGKIVLGVSDKRPRTVVGTQAFPDFSRTKHGLLQELGMRINAIEYTHSNGRVVVFAVPPRMTGRPVQYRGAYWMRSGESLVPMTPDRLRVVLNEAVLDYSSTVYDGASSSHLDPAAINSLRELWMRKSGNERLAHLTDEQLLMDAGLLIDGRPCHASLVLLGTAAAVRRYLPQSELVFEYRSSESSIEYQQREEFREGFLLFQEDLLNLVQARNDIQHFQVGLAVFDVPTYSIRAVREVVLNAISHREYRLPGSVFLRLYPRRMEIASPGGFPAGVTADNILWRQVPRNRLISETLSRCGLVERSGQGVDLVFEELIKQGKLIPDFRGTDEHQVSVTLHGEVQNPQFLSFLGAVGTSRLQSFSPEDLWILHLISREERIPAELTGRIKRLAGMGIVERVGVGRGTKYILSRSLYTHMNKKGEYTRKRGLDRATNKALLLKHIIDNGSTGTRFSELRQVLPSLTRGSISSLLIELRSEGKIHSMGVTRNARWYPTEDD